MKWYRKAAEQGNAQAQFSLGGMYFCGEGVPKDDTEAYVWVAVAAANGHEDAEYILSAAREDLAPGQLAAADQRVAELTAQIDAAKRCLEDHSEDSPMLRFFPQGVDSEVQ